jgi:hypothetical protein
VAEQIRLLAVRAPDRYALRRQRERLFTELTTQQDPRMLGRGAIFDGYVHANPGHVGFYERYLRGEKMNTGWVNASDFEARPPAAPATSAPNFTPTLRTKAR